MDRRGILIVLEGSDGSGKTTQFNLLSERLKAAGYDVAVFDFPRYNKESSYFIKQYLNGKFGPAGKISPYTASLFYALDRYEAAKDIRKELQAGKIVLADRYVGSNMAHQGAKFGDSVEQRGFFVWEDNLEFQLLNIPRPDINIFLRVPAEVSFELMSRRAGRDYTKQVRDEHEADLEYLKKSVKTYDLLCQLFPKDFSAIESTKNGELMTIPQISNLIWDKIQPLLPASKPHAGHSAIVTLSSHSKPNQTNDSDSSSDKLVQQFNNASLLLKLQIERQIKSIEPAGLSIWSDNNYKFYTPMGLPKELESFYKQTMEQLSRLHQEMRIKLESYYEKNLLSSGQVSPPNISAILLPVTPLAALCDFKAILSERAVARTASSLLTNDSDELQWAAKQLYIAARQKWPEDFKRPLESDSSPEPINSIIAKLAEDRLSLNSADSQEVKLLEATPRQEFDLLAETIYPYSNLSLEEITEEVSDWSFQQKYEAFGQAANDPALLLEKIQYKFDIISDQIVLSEFINNAVLNNLQMQLASPRYGYEVPEAVEAAGIDELYMDCFDECLKLFSLLQEAGRDELTVYATLLGHKLRWQFSIDAKNMKLILDYKSDDSYSKIKEIIKEKVTEVHPLTWEVVSGTIADSNSYRPTKNRVKPSKRRPSRRSRSSKPKDK